MHDPPGTALMEVLQPARRAQGHPVPRRPRHRSTAPVELPGEAPEAREGEHEKVLAAVNADADEARDVRVAHVHHVPQLGQEPLQRVPPFPRHQPLHRHQLAAGEAAAVHLGEPAPAHHVVPAEVAGGPLQLRQGEGAQRELEDAELLRLLLRRPPDGAHAPERRRHRQHAPGPGPPQRLQRLERRAADRFRCSCRLAPGRQGDLPRRRRRAVVVVEDAPPPGDAPGPGPPPRLQRRFCCSCRLRRGALGRRRRAVVVDDVPPGDGLVAGPPALLPPHHRLYMYAQLLLPLSLSFFCFQSSKCSFFFIIFFLGVFN
jgi:hypothetical protein